MYSVNLPNCKRNGTARRPTTALFSNLFQLLAVIKDTFMTTNSFTNHNNTSRKSHIVVEDLLYDEIHLINPLCPGIASVRTNIAAIRRPQDFAQHHIRLRKS